MSIQFTGKTFAVDDGSAVFLLNMGEGNGFLLGIKIGDFGISNMTGAKKFVDVSVVGTRGAGTLKMESETSGTLYHVDQYGNEIVGNLSGMMQIPAIPNMYLSNVTFPDQSGLQIYSVSANQMFMFFAFDADDGSFWIYGAGAKLE
jgi:hypothetical protein